MFEREKVLEVCMLFGYNRLEGLVEPFTKGMDDASTVRTDRSGADVVSLVDFNQQIEVSEQIGEILLSVVPNIVCCRV